jgi:hypothetical protein
MNADMNLDGGILSGGLCVEFAWLEFGEIHCRRAFEALLAGDCSVARFFWTAATRVRSKRSRGLITT